MKLWTCDQCKAVVRQDDGVPRGWTLNLFAGVGPVCRDCQPQPSKQDLKREKHADR